MIYQYYPQKTTKEQRKSLNDKVLYLIDNGNHEQFAISKEDIFNAYSGDGGLHGLKCQDFDNYYEYSEAKKDIENGQFFTPAPICQLVMACLNPGNDDLIADLTCGMGNFFNYAPIESNVYGCELDIKAFKVAQFLYPAANLENKDIRLYQPEVRFDYIVGNPPFNLKWWTKEDKDILSQFYYCQKAAQLLKPLGILALITPASFLVDEFADRSMIEAMEKDFNFLGQVALADNAFAALGVNSFSTKIQFWQKKSHNIEAAVKPYSTNIDLRLSKDFILADMVDQVFVKLLAQAKAELIQNRTKLILEFAKDKQYDRVFVDDVKKMLYHIYSNPKLNKYYNKCCEYLHRFQTQEKPPDMTYEQWQKSSLTEAKVLSYLKRVLKKQHQKPPRDIIALVKRDFDFVYKGYSVKMQRKLSAEEKKPIPIHQAVLYDQANKYPGYERLLRKKKRDYQQQNQLFAFMQADEDIGQWLDNFWLWDKENEEEILFNDLQKHDLNLVMQKSYAMLQWEQGSGKTLAGIAVGMYRMEKQGIYCSFVLSPAISIKNNWQVVLPNYGLAHIMIEKLADLDKIKQGDFVLITLDKVRQYKKQLKKWLKIHKQKVQLIFDESDEITNPDSKRTKAVLSCFRHCKMKLLDSGTIIRNNISEFAPQLELLYNNSLNMTSWCQTIYRQERANKKTGIEEGLNSYSNPYFGQPIPAYKTGYSLFAASHLPAKITVFGIEQRNQDIYNADELSDLLDKTVITRTFEEVSGKQIKRLHQVPVTFSANEKAVYIKAIEEFYAMRENYFSLSGNSRKDSMMVLIQQINLLLRISAAPNTLKEYQGGVPVKIRKVVDMAKSWDDEIVVIGVRHKAVLDAYAQVIRETMPERPLFVVTGSTTTFAKRRALRKTLRESKNGILLCTQQSLPSSVNFEYVNKIIIPELHYNNSRMSQFYFRFIRYNSVDFKDIYFVTYAGSIESNQMQMVLAKEKLNLFMKGQNTDLDEVYQRFGVDYDLLSLLMKREEDDEGKFHIRWGEQLIS